MRVADFDYELPEEQIAQAPLAERDASRLLVLPRRTGPTRHRTFRELPELLSAGDLLVVNDTRVVPARMTGHKVASGGRVEALLVEPVDGTVWRAICGSSKPIRLGAELDFGGLSATVAGLEGEGSVLLDLGLSEPEVYARLEAGLGALPLPPYIRRDPTAADQHRYQTPFADKPGAVAAPTAGLHFTPRVLEALSGAGVALATVTLRVGPGTFLPVRVEAVADHKMHFESYEVPAATVEAVARTRAGGGRVIAVGTTALRTLEAATDEGGALVPGPGRTDIFIHPGYTFRAIDGLLTNFHLPRSTLLMLVSALAGTGRVLAAYREAVEAGYRFFSYGDAMLVLPEPE